MPPKTVVIIPCHNQQKIISLITLPVLEKQSVLPDKVLVINDHSMFRYKKYLKTSKFVEVVDSPERGRVAVRNFGIDWALDNGYEFIIFMDGDCFPQHKDYIYNYLQEVKRAKKRGEEAKAIFGLRKHIPKPKHLEDYRNDLDYEIIPISKYPSDLLTANLDKKRIFNNEDLRVISGAYKVFNESKDIFEKLATLATGMVTWSCNFGITTAALTLLKEFKSKYFHVGDYFDLKTFMDTWGGEDNVFGEDLLASGCDICLSKKSYVYHFMHERSDSLFTHIKINSIMMNRYYELRKILETQS